MFSTVTVDTYMWDLVFFYQCMMEFNASIFLSIGESKKVYIHVHMDYAVLQGTVVAENLDWNWSHFQQCRVLRENRRSVPTVNQRRWWLSHWTFEAFQAVGGDVEMHYAAPASSTAPSAHLDGVLSSSSTHIFFHLFARLIFSTCTRCTYFLLCLY